MTRPTVKEIHNKLSQAKSAVEHGAVQVINPRAFAADAIELGYRMKRDLPSVLLGVLTEATPRHYAGGRPPTRSYDDRLMENELYAFRLKPTRFNVPVYLKFTLFDETLWLVSLHRNRKNNGGRSHG